MFMGKEGIRYDRIRVVTFARLFCDIIRDKPRSVLNV